MLLPLAASAAAAAAPAARLPPVGLENRSVPVWHRGGLGVVNGRRVTDIREFEQAACLLDDTQPLRSSHFCGGSLVHPQWVLTAAHCVYTNPQANSVVEARLRTLDYSRAAAEEGAVTRGLTTPWVVIHPDYDHRLLTNDVALYKLASPVTDVDPLPLYGGADDLAGDAAVVVGWGSTDNAGHQYEYYMQQGDVSVGTRAECERAWGSGHNGYRHATQLCAGTDLGGGRWVEAGYGDSGGPLMARRGGRLEQIGVVSYGATPPTYNGYMRVSAYKAWIERTIAEN